MAMTYREFVLYARRLVEISEKLGDGWRELACSENKTIYLVKTQRDVMIRKRYHHDDQIVEPQVSDSYNIFLTSWKLPRLSNEVRCTPVLTEQKSSSISFNEDLGETSTMETVLEGRHHNDSEILKRLILTESPTSSNVQGRTLTVSKNSLVNIEPNQTHESNEETDVQTNSTSKSSYRSQVQKLDRLDRTLPIELSRRSTEHPLSPSLVNLCNNVEIDVEDDLVTHVPEDTLNPSFTWEYHIVYSSSYAVPVLYFNVWNSSGALLELDHVWRILEFNVENNWTALTQVEHPYLRKPYFQLHPCRTQHLIELITHQTENSGDHQVNKLISWLSCIAPYVLLDFSIEYGNAGHMTSMCVDC